MRNKTEMTGTAERCTRAAAAVMATVLLGAGVAMAQQGGMSSPQQQTVPGGAQTGGMNAPGGVNSPGSMNSMANMSMASPQDKMFLKNAGAGDMFEIQTSQLALQKSSSDDVKQFAQMMIDDHTKLENQMKPIVAEANVQPPTGLMGKDKGEYKKLQGLSGDAFDKEYISAMVMDHSKVSKDFAAEANSGQLQDEKMAAAQNKPTVDMHLQKAQALAQAHGVATTM